MLRPVILILVSVTLGISALLLWKNALDAIGGFELGQANAISQFGRLFGRWQFWLGIVPLVGVVLISLDLWSNEELSKVIPMYSLSYVIIALIGKMFLGEQVTAMRWGGISVIIVGIIMLVAS